MQTHLDPEWHHEAASASAALVQLQVLCLGQQVVGALVHLGQFVWGVRAWLLV